VPGGWWQQQQQQWLLSVQQDGSVRYGTNHFEQEEDKDSDCHSNIEIGIKVREDWFKHPEHGPAFMDQQANALVASCCVMMGTDLMLISRGQDTISVIAGILAAVTLFHSQFCETFVSSTGRGDMQYLMVAARKATEEMQTIGLSAQLRALFQ
jgi:hypothetical protein